MMMKSVWKLMFALLIVVGFMSGSASAENARADYWFNQGEKYYQQHNYDQAIKAYSMAIKLSPKMVEAYNNRGICYEENKDHDAAIADYTKGMEFGPKNAKLYYNRAISYGEKEEYEQAVTDYTKASELNPKYANAYFNKALDLDKLERYEEAREAFGLFIKYAPANDSNLRYARDRYRELGE